MKYVITRYYLLVYLLTYCTIAIISVLLVQFHCSSYCILFRVMFSCCTILKNTRKRHNAEQYSIYLYMFVTYRDTSWVIGGRTHRQTDTHTHKQTIKCTLSVLTSARVPRRIVIYSLAINGPDINPFYSTFQLQFVNEMNNGCRRK